MVVITGRRRVGKTTLVRRAFEELDAPCLYFFANAEKTERANVADFFAENAEKLGLEGLAPSLTLRELLEFLFKRAQKTPLILVLDEFQNFKHMAPGFFGDLQNLWDKHRKTSKILLAAAGSVTSAMKEATEAPDAPLCGRPSAFIRLAPFSTSLLKAVYKECCQESGTPYVPDNYLALWTLTGGVAKYVELLIEAECLTKEAMFAYAVDPSSFFVSEGTVLLHTEFKSDYATYFEILQQAARGRTRRRELVAHFPDRDISGQLLRLEEHYRLLYREMPFGSAAGARNYRLVLNDEFLRFWFRYVYGCAAMIENNNSGRVVEMMLDEFADFTGRFVLERYFRRQLLETGRFACAGSWWDRRGQNEIDVVALDPVDKSLLFVEVKREEKRINLDVLRERAWEFLTHNAAYRTYAMRYEGRSLKDL